jgi:hypothetical protein
MSERIERLVDGRWALAETVLVVLAAAAAWVIRFAQDDAFITYRYSRNLARGEGLVFNTGERVEGYTNFLWTVLHAVPERLGWSTPLFSQIVGIATMVGAVLLTGVLARRLFDSRGLALLAQAALVANVTFLGYGTGGLETMLQTLLVLGVMVALLPFGTGRSVDHGWPVRRLVAGLLGGLAVLKDWIARRAPLFNQRTLDAGLPIPTGLLLMGISGCGKSLCAKLIAQAWRVPIKQIRDGGFNLDMKNPNVHRGENDMPQVWARNYGKGRVFVAGLGHDSATSEL